MDRKFFAFVRICGVKLKDRKNTLELMERLGLNELMLEVVPRRGLRWMGHVLRREDEDPIKMAWETGWKCRKGKRTAKNDLEGQCQEGSKEVWVVGRGCERPGQVEKKGIDE